VANHPSAEKRNRQRQKRTARNRSIKTAVRGIVKKVRAAITQGDATTAETALKSAIAALDGAVSKGALPRKTASRSISRLTIAVSNAPKKA
jgi:small subunit ribosomal protein S20